MKAHNVSIEMRFAVEPAVTDEQFENLLDRVLDALSVDVEDLDYTASLTERTATFAGWTKNGVFRSSTSPNSAKERA